jgi:hypothetical protein
MDMSRVSGTRPSYSGSAHDGILSAVTLFSHAKRLLPWRVAVASFMESLDTTILNTAVPALANPLAVAPLSMRAVLSS